MEETFNITPSPLFFLPVRMPGITVKVECSVPSFQLSLKGGCDEQGLFYSQSEPHCWIMRPFDFALGRLVYDIIWEDGVTEPLDLNLTYATLQGTDVTKSPTSATTTMYSPMPLLDLKTWSLRIHPRRWIPLPPTRHRIHTIRLQHPRTQGPAATTTVPEFHLAVAMIPPRILPRRSSHGSLQLDASLHPNLLENGLDFSYMFGAWLVLDEDIDWLPQIVYGLVSLDQPQ